MTAQASGFLARSGPAEIIIHILQYCDSTRDLLALVSTCRHVYDVWQANIAVALWPVCLRDIPHIQDAVTAVRMTQLVVDAERRGELPPTRISPDQLQHRPQPTLAELRAAFGFRRLSHAMAESFCEHTNWYPSDRHAPDPEEPGRCPEWIARVDQAVFRVLIISAALAGAYQEPLFKAREHPDPEIKALLRRLPRDDSLAQGNYNLGDKELAFLMQFAVCDLDATIEAQDAVFGPIAEWLHESILSDRASREAMAKRFDLGYGRAGHSDAHLVVWELMKMLWVAEHVRPDGLDRSGVLGRVPPDPQTTEDLGVDEEIHHGPLQSAVAISFGKFRAERVMLPMHTFGPREGLTAHPEVPRTSEEDPSGMSIAVFFDWLFYHSGRLNHTEDSYDAVAPLDLKFFEYFLQHLGLCFDAATFREDEMDFLNWSYQEFTEGITIFSHDDVGDRGAFYMSSVLAVGDFLDGSEILTKYPPEFERIYQLRREW
ncbi:hypothetical protein C8A01DRAFT_32717 [Parachaetomium inaequale]|uniref:F-box domain-containing protein n=1 Tax=Parachaetomium inaequale TaxID=2588326 RepID=A0AAN6PNQ8_9PEZI|nr:hypothetical protein C8A01DRAFT_32717 [Parachaetomium inaequale]